MAMSNGREERRRRIAERGSDRLALITGRVQSLSSSQFSPTHPDHSRTESSPPFFSLDNEIPHAPNFSDPIKTAAKDGYGAFGSKSLKQDTGVEFSRGNNFDIPKKAEPQFPQTERQFPKAEPQFPKSTLSREVVKTPVVEDRIKTQPSPVSTNFFTPKQINSSIIASENKRIFCALIIAILVVFGKIVSSESAIASRPLYIVLLTDVTIVLGTLFLENQGSSEEAEEKTSVPQDDGHNWVGAVKVLETGLMLYQCIRAIFIDCSVYLVIVICSFSLL